MVFTNFLIKVILITTVTLGGAKITLDGTFPKVGDKAPDFTLVNGELKDISLSDFKGKRVLLNIFPRTRSFWQYPKTFRLPNPGSARQRELKISPAYRHSETLLSGKTTGLP